MATININIGILGHIDSGKTSIARALSSEASTAAFDKSPQSQERGITLDLGFSAFTVPLPADSPLVTKHGYANAQFTLVDCPGHASLIRTIIGGSQIMDAMLLVIDAVKGIQTQTSEGIVIGSLATRKLVVALNKIDQLAAPAAVKKASERLGKALTATPFTGAPIIPVSAAPKSADGSTPSAPSGIDKLKEALLGMVDESILTKREAGTKEPFLMAVDHCFTVKGQGTVVTGTVLRGSLKPNDTVEVPELKSSHKVKSIQMFRKPVQSASLGDRIGVALPSLDAKAFERGIVAAPRSVPTVHALVGRVEKIPYFKEDCLSKEKFHVTVGHSTVMASVLFFGSAGTADGGNAEEPWSREKEHAYLSALPPKGTGAWVLLEFEKPLSCPTGAVFIGSHLDSDTNKNACRIAFHGKVVDFFDRPEAARETLKLFKPKMKEGTVDRVLDSHSIIMKGMFKSKASPTLYVGLKVHLKKEGEADREGIIDSPFGKSGKYKVVFGSDFEIQKPKQVMGLKLTFNYKKYMFKKSDTIIQ